MLKVKTICFMLLMGLCVRCFAAADYAKQYDPARDPAKDLQAALLAARTEGKLVLMEIGGDWCVWCHRLDEFLHSDTKLWQQLNDVFVLLKVNVSEENENKAFLSQFPAVIGYPHIFVLNPSGELLASQNTGELEQGKSYSKTNVVSFISKWQATLKSAR